MLCQFVHCPIASLKIKLSSRRQPSTIGTNLYTNLCIMPTSNVASLNLLILALQIPLYVLYLRNQYTLIGNCTFGWEFQALRFKILVHYDFITLAFTWWWWRIVHYDLIQYKWLVDILQIKMQRNLIEIMEQSMGPNEAPLSIVLLT